MKKIIKIMGYFAVSILLVSFPAYAGEMSDDEIMRELKETKKRLEQLESMLKARSGETGAFSDIKEESPEGRKSLEDRVQRVEEQLKEKPLLGTWTERITLNGTIEVEAAYEDMDFDDPTAEDEESSDIALATVEVGIDADITKHVGGHLLFLWEEDETEPVDLDEGYIILDGKDVVPLYLNAGKMYVPFGNFESHFISDPLTLEIGETRESAVKIGFANDMFDICLTGFNGDIDETGDDDHIKGFVGSAIFTLPAETVPDLNMMLGASYISSIADTDGLEAETPGEIEDYVGGLGLFLSASYLEKFFVEVEYLGALDSFEADELSFDGGKKFEPKAWNVEFAFVPFKDLKLAIKYEGGDDLGDFLPESQYGGAITYSLFENTSLAVEYLHGEFENDDKRDLLTTQIAIEL